MRSTKEERTRKDEEFFLFLTSLDVTNQLDTLVCAVCVRGCAWVCVRKRTQNSRHNKGMSQVPFVYQYQPLFLSYSLQLPIREFEIPGNTYDFIS